MITTLTMEAEDIETEDAKFLNFSKYMFGIKIYLRTGKYPKNYNAIQKKSVRHSVRNNSFTLKDSQLFHKKGERYLKVVTSLEERNTIISLHHLADAPIAGVHCSINSTVLRISQKYWWNGVKQDVKSYVSRCNVCRQNDKNGTRKTRKVEREREPPGLQICEQNSNSEEMSFTQRDMNNQSPIIFDESSTAESHHTDDETESWESYINRRRESCIQDICSLVPHIEKVAVNALEADLFSLRFYLKNFIRRNCKRVLIQKRKKSSAYSQENVRKKRRVGQDSRLSEDNSIIPVVDLVEVDDDSPLNLPDPDNQALENQAQDCLTNTTTGVSKEPCVINTTSDVSKEPVINTTSGVTYAVLGLYKEVIGNGKDYVNITQEWEKDGEKKLFYYGTDSEEVSNVRQKCVAMGLPTCLIRNSAQTSTVAAVFIDDSLSHSILENMELIDAQKL
ncbi:SPT10-like [Homarus americanus]|uniref:peptidyl-tRNA hydrolase n=1 Tax=Homarus americanus TaxID=6706 RepID=A0A8J5JN40_HOMAM|nr:SPT10-like [Homarus americanus]